MSNTANNFVGGNSYPIDEQGAEVIFKSANTAGVHVPSVNVDNISVNLSPTNLALDASLQSMLAALPAVRLEAKTPGASQKVAVGAASAASTAITGTAVRVVASVNCHLAFGASPAAAADGTCVYLPAGVPQVFTITSGWKAAVIEDSGAGNLFITVVS